MNYIVRRVLDSRHFNAEVCRDDLLGATVIAKCYTLDDANLICDALQKAEAHASTDSAD